MRPYAQLYPFLTHVYIHLPIHLSTHPSIHPMYLYFPGSFKTTIVYFSLLVPREVIQSRYGLDPYTLADPSTPPLPHGEQSAPQDHQISPYPLWV